MRTIFISSLLLVFGLCTGQSQEQTKEARAEEIPRLEIPEITIVGKKAITLPFARKGEVYDVEVFSLPPPDSSLLGIPPSMSLLSGKLPRHEHYDQPWRSSIDGAFGSFASGHVNGYVDYKGRVWSLGGTAGVASSNGHVENSSLTRYDIGGSARAIVSTDNRILKSLSAEGGLSFARSEYGLFGIPGGSVRRSNSVVGLQLGIHSLNRTGSYFDLAFTSKFNTLSDKTPAGDSSVSAISPIVRAQYTLPVKRVGLATSFIYSSSSLTYQHPAQSPSLTGLNVAASWTGGNRWRFEAGGTLTGGADSKGGDESLIMPFGVSDYAIDSLSRLSFWFRPEMRYAGYAEQMEIIPYLSREIDLRPERKPVAIGASYALRQNLLTFTLTGDYAWYSTKEMIIARGGEIVVEYAEATFATLSVEGSLEHWQKARLNFTAVLSSAHEQGSTTQLPMVPLLKLVAREEMKFSTPLSVWASLEYESPRNVDRGAAETLSSLFLANCGAEYALSGRVVLGARITNLFNVAYEWWKEYPAPRIGFALTASVRFQ